VTAAMSTPERIFAVIEKLSQLATSKAGGVDELVTISAIRHDIVDLYEKVHDSGVPEPVIEALWTLSKCVVRSRLEQCQPHPADELVEPLRKDE